MPAVLYIPAQTLANPPHVILHSVNRHVHVWKGRRLVLNSLGPHFIASAGCWM